VHPLKQERDNQLKKYIGHDGHQYDSQAESAASFRFAELGCIAAKQVLPHVFTDAEGTEFQACADFYYPASGLYLEFKCAALNGVKSKASAERQLASRAAFRSMKRQALLMIDGLKYQWNHARRKQAIVQAKLTPQNFIVVFDKPPTAEAADAYRKAGIVFVPLYALPSYLLYARLAKAGIQTGFLLRYRADDAAAQSVLTLGPYDPAGWLYRAELA